tara:strand:- start:499 stop:1440 length:942 start_codon:yes stop_codon:yes gene_type:complete
MKKPEFYEWQTMYQTVKAAADKDRLRDLKEQGVVAFYEEVARFANNQGRTLLEFGHLQLDAMLARFGAPYFKIYPGIAHMLCGTSMNLPTDTLRLPFEQMYIRLPKDCGLPNEMEAALATRSMASHGLGGLKGLFITWRDNTDLKNLSTSIVCLDLDAFDTIEESILDATNTIEGGDGNSSESINAIVRIVVGACFFGIGQHEIILPDVPRKHFDKWFRAKRQNDEPTMKRLEKKTDGFTVGREIDLPEATMTLHGERKSGGGMELAHSHLRRGHMRWQACGEKNCDRKLIFVPPSVIRPDLPARPQGYRVDG